MGTPFLAGTMSIIFITVPCLWHLAQCLPRLGLLPKLVPPNVVRDDSANGILDQNFGLDYRVENEGNSLAVPWLGLRAFTAEGPGSVPGWGTKIPQALWHSQKKKKIYIYIYIFIYLFNIYIFFYFNALKLTCNIKLRCNYKYGGKIRKISPEGSRLISS